LNTLHTKLFQNLISPVLNFQKHNCNYCIGTFAYRLVCQIFCVSVLTFRTLFYPFLSAKIKSEVKTLVSKGLAYHFSNHFLSIRPRCLMNNEQGIWNDVVKTSTFFTSTFHGCKTNFHNHEFIAIDFSRRKKRQ
jgi:hypothetical protein